MDKLISNSPLIDVSPSGGFMELYDGTNSKATNPVVLIILSATILFYFVIFSYFGNSAPTEQIVQNNQGMNIIELIMWGLFIFLILINGLQYFFDINVKTALKSISGTPEVDIQLNSNSNGEINLDNINKQLPKMNLGRGLGNLIGDGAKNILGAGGKIISDGVEFTMNSAGKLVDGKGNIVEEASEIIKKGNAKIVDNAGNISDAISLNNNRSQQNNQDSSNTQQNNQDSSNTQQNNQQQNNQNPNNMLSNSLGDLPSLSGSDVFHVANNKYTYSEAQAVCKAFGGKLASYEDMERAYNNGGEWCSYGWSKDQMALFPTQISTWKKLQEIDGHKNDCGRPGINGGYIENKNVRYGANCVGKRPRVSEEEQIILNSVNPYPKSREDKKIDRMVDNYKKNLQSIKIAPFNSQNWNRL